MDGRVTESVRNFDVSEFQHSDCQIFRNLFPLYLHEMSVFHSVIPNEFGLFSEDDHKSTADDSYLKTLCDKPNVCRIVLARENSRPVGFLAEVRGEKYVPCEFAHEIRELFVVNARRRSSCASQLVDQCLRNRVESSSLIRIFSANQLGSKFWHSYALSRQRKFEKIRAENQIDHFCLS